MQICSAAANGAGWWPGMANGNRCPRRNWLTITKLNEYREFATKNQQDWIMSRKGIGEYPEGWPEFANQLKEQAGWKCTRCGHPHEPTAGYTLTVHHLTMNKAESFDRWWAFAILCQRCHLTIQSKVVLERPWLYEHSEWFKRHAAGYYAYCQGLPDDREYVMAHMDELLKVGQMV